MTGREAIYYVHTARPEQVDEWLVSGESSSLRRVCWMRINEPDGWRALLNDLGLVDTPPERMRPKDRAIQLWREDFWTIAALAAKVGLTVETLSALRRRRLRGATWAIRAAGRHQTAYRLLEAA